MMCQWVQKFLGCLFTIIHQPARMMVGVDRLSRRFGHTAAQYLCVAILLHKVSAVKLLYAYIHDMAADPEVTSLKPVAVIHNYKRIILTTSTILSYTTLCIPQSVVALFILDKFN